MDSMRDVIGKPNPDAVAHLFDEMAAFEAGKNRIKSVSHLRDLSLLEKEILDYVSSPDGLTSVTAEDVINRFVGASEALRMEVAMAVAYLSENLYIARDMRTLALTSNCCLTGYASL